MNLVKQIMDQLSGDTLGHLGSLLGTDAETTERAATAAVPSLLSALSGAMSSEDGVKKVTNVLGGFDSSGVGNIAQMLSGNASSVLSKGTNMLGSLFGDSMISNLAGALSRFSGLNASVVKSLLAYLSPLVLGKVASQWKSQGGTSQALKSLVADQRDNIKNAMPAGFSLSDIPGLADVRQAAYSTSRKAEIAPVAARSPASWLVPLAIALLGGFFLWHFLSGPKEERKTAAIKPAETADRVTAMKPVLPDTTALPDLATVRDGISTMFKSLTTTLSDVKDSASAERAMPALKDLDAKIDTMQQMLSRLPAASTTALCPLIEEQVKVVTEKAKAVDSIAGIGQEFRSLIQQIVAKISKWISADSR